MLMMHASDRAPVDERILERLRTWRTINTAPRWGHARSKNVQLSQRTHSLDMTLSVAVKIVTFQCVCVGNRDVRKHIHATIGSLVSYDVRNMSGRCRDAPQCRLNRCPVVWSFAQQHTVQRRLLQGQMGLTQLAVG